MTPVMILGAGTFAIEVLEAIEIGGLYEPVGFVVSDARLITEPLLCGLPVVALADRPWQPTETVAIAAIVSTRRAAFIRAVEEQGFRFATVIHRRAIVSPRASVGDGCFVGAGAIIASHTRLGPHVLVNRGANIGHDGRLDSYVTVGPGVIIAGGVGVERGSYLGVGAVVRDHVTIGEGAVVAAGAVVVKSVPPHAMVAGCPARVVRDDVDPL